jgi:hypothetical protein
MEERWALIAEKHVLRTRSVRLIQFIQSAQLATTSLGEQLRIDLS